MSYRAVGVDTNDDGEKWTKANENINPANGFDSWELWKIRHL